MAAGLLRRRALRNKLKHLQPAWYAAIGALLAVGILQYYHPHACHQATINHDMQLSRIASATIFKHDSKCVRRVLSDNHLKAASDHLKKLGVTNLTGNCAQLGLMLPCLTDDIFPVTDNVGLILHRDMLSPLRLVPFMLNLHRHNVHALVQLTSFSNQTTVSIIDLNTAGVVVYYQATVQFRERFNRIYAALEWSSMGGGSGDGSTLNATQRLRHILPQLIAKYNISSMIDTSCGSMHWMPHVLATVKSWSPNFKFHGSDVVCNLTDRHPKTFVDEPHWSFGCLDFANEPLPKGYDLIWSRDALQHLPLHGTWQFLNNVRESGARYVFIGSYLTHPYANRDIKAGEYYRINVLEPPFSLSPKPIEIIEEQYDGKHMLMFDMHTITWNDPWVLDTL